MASKLKKDYNPDKLPSNQMLRQEYACDDEWIKAFLGQARIGHVATHWDEQPFITPTTFWYDDERREIYFHSNIIGRLRANAERHEQVCFEACISGELLPSNIALEFSIQYESVIVFGNIRVLDDPDEKRYALYGLINKYFPHVVAGEHYRPITSQELRRTAVYAIVINLWSGKRNWPERAEQSPDWPALSV